MDNDLMNCPSHSSRPICTSSDAPRCHHVPTNTFFCSFSTQKYCPAFIYSNFPSDPSSFLCFFSHFPPFHSVSLLPSFITQKKDSEMDWHRILWPFEKTTPLWSFGSRMCRIPELRSRSSAPLLPENSVIKWEETNQTRWLLVPIIKAAKIANQLS